MMEFYDYFLSIRYYFVLESFIVLMLLVAVMLRFGKLVQGGEKIVAWSSPRPASRAFSAAAGLLWISGSLMVIQPEKMIVIGGICCVIAGIQLATHINLMMMAVWYFSKTGRTMLGMGSQASRERHKFYLQKAKNRGRICLEKAKNHGPIWSEKIVRW